MQRITTQERRDWKNLANKLGFKFHTIDGEAYWDESAYYKFSLKQIENDLEDPTGELHNMCMDLVDRVVDDEHLLKRLHIPEFYWDYVRESWKNGEKHLYGRMDFSYDGNSPAKFLEYNADTPTSLYESAFFQWIWLEQCIERGLFPNHADQYNSIQEHLIEAFSQINPPQPLYFSCCKNTEEDRGTVQYMQDCATQAGLETKFVYIDDIGISPIGQFTDLENFTIPSLFKLYAWEWLMTEEFGQNIPNSNTWFIEPPWKSILSNKGILPLLWELHPNHPNLLPSYFEDEQNNINPKHSWVRKPLFSREGSNISIVVNGNVCEQVDGPYDDSGYILQAYKAIPRFGTNHTLIGSWVVADRPCGISIREDCSTITKDSSRYLPHVIID